MVKRIGILTTGGDCSGLNSVIRAVYLRAKSLGYDVVGIRRGFRGLASDVPDYLELSDDICNENMLIQSGSIILSDTKWMSQEVKSGKSLADIKNMVRRGYAQLNLEGLICVGGDGSLNLVNELSSDNDDLKIVFIPKTIDNDVNYTDFSVGFQTSVEVAVKAIENIRSTARSHERTMVVEVMGRGAGFISMYAGVASGADVILVPEFKYDFDKVVEKVNACSSSKGYCIIVVAESVESDDFTHSEKDVNSFVKYTHLTYKGIGQHLVRKLKDRGVDSRCVTLGHVQRGGETCINDRLLGSLFGSAAVNLVADGDFGKLLVFSKGKLQTMDIKSSVATINRSLSSDDEYVKVAKNLGVYVGEI